MFSSKTFISFRLKKDMDVLDDMGVSKLSENVVLKSDSFKFNLLIKKYTFIVLG